MAGWEEELAVILRDLGVQQEDSKVHLQSVHKPIRSDAKQPEHSAHPFSCRNENNTENEETWIQDLSTMRREVDAIVNQVILLMQRGDLDRSLKEDVMAVMRVLHRRIISTQLATSDEAYLESASAMLHFCRIVLQLSEFAAEDF